MEEQSEKLIMTYLADSQDAATQADLAAALEAGELEAGKVAEMKAFYDRLEALPVPEPSPVLRAEFYQMLAREKKKQQAKGAWQQAWSRWLTRLRQELVLGKLAYSLVLLALGIWLGSWYSQRPQQDSGKLLALTAEVAQLRQMMMLTLLEQPSATDRLKAVNLTTDMDQANTRVIQALLQTLNHDPSVNVRLAAIEALYQHAGNPTARAGLVQAIGRQESPLVQLALADIMLAMQEKAAVDQFRQLLKKKDLNEAVKAKVEQTIQVLI